MEENQKQEKNSNLDVDSLKSILNDLNKTKPKKKGLFSKIFSKNDEKESLEKDNFAKEDKLTNANLNPDLKKDNQVPSFDNSKSQEFKDILKSKDKSEKANQNTGNNQYNVDDSKTENLKERNMENEEKDNIDEELLELKGRISKIRNMIDDSVTDLNEDVLKNNHDSKNEMNDNQNQILNKDSAKELNKVTNQDFEKNETKESDFSKLNDILKKENVQKEKGDSKVNYENNSNNKAKNIFDNVVVNEKLETKHNLVSDEMIFFEKEKEIEQKENQLKDKEIELNNREIELNNRYNDFLDKYNFLLKYYEEFKEYIKSSNVKKSKPKKTSKKVNVNRSNKKNSSRSSKKVNSNVKASSSKNDAKKKMKKVDDKSKSNDKQNVKKTSDKKVNKTLEKPKEKKVNPYHLKSKDDLISLSKQKLIKNDITDFEKILKELEKKVKNSSNKEDELKLLEIRNDYNLIKIEKELNQ